jgi:hypothetical protein
LTKRQPSNSPSAVAARERRFYRHVDREEREMLAHVGMLMQTGLTFDDAWVAAGGDPPIPIDYFYEHKVN